MADKAFDAEHTFLDAVDDFTVLFHSDRVFVRKQEYPVGQCVVDILNVEEEELSAIDQALEDVYHAIWHHKAPVYVIKDGVDVTLK